MGLLNDIFILFWFVWETNARKVNRGRSKDVVEYDETRFKSQETLL